LSEINENSIELICSVGAFMRGLLNVRFIKGKRGLMAIRGDGFGRDFQMCLWILTGK
jgi:hypothetical protein